MSSKLAKEQVNEVRGNKGSEKIVGAFVLFVLCGLPLVFQDFYFNILEVKYYYYCACVLIMGAVLLAYAIFTRSQRKKDDSVGYRGSIIKLIKSFHITDAAVFLFWVIAGISTISSRYLYESFWGNEGRYSGFFLISLYVFAYFAVTRLGKFKTSYVDYFLAAAMLVCLFGITDYFQMDLLGFKQNMDPGQVPIFTSTLGNINTYTAFVGIVTGVSAVLYTTSRDRKYSFYYYICMVISFFAIIMGVSDNAYITLAALFGLLPLYLFNEKERIKRYIVVIATFFTVIQCIDWINTFMGETVLGIDSAFGLIIRFKGLILIVAGFWLLLGIWSLAEKRMGAEWNIRGNGLKYVWLTLLVLIMAFVVYALYDCNIAGNAARYESLSNYLVFNDDWGTHRGYIWRNTMESFGQFSLWEKLVGFGPDTLGIVLKDKTQNNIYHQIFDSAHNEYLHYLITVGFAGLIAYIAFLGSYFVRCVRNAQDRPYVMALMFGVICYAAQAAVNINLPIVTPIMWLMLALGVKGCSDHTSNEKS